MGVHEGAGNHCQSSQCSLLLNISPALLLVSKKKKKKRTRSWGIRRWGWAWEKVKRGVGWIWSKYIAWISQRFNKTFFKEYFWILCQVINLHLFLWGWLLGIWCVSLFWPSYHVCFSFWKLSWSLHIWWNDDVSLCPLTSWRKTLINEKS